MGNKWSRIFAVALAFIFIYQIDPAWAQGEAKREITHIAGDLYRFKNNFHYSVFLVTPEGVIATDPINVDAARWLRSEIKKRFNKPVRYLIYSHDHSDHISGGEVFADTAIVIAHENAKRTIIGEKRPTAIPDITFSDKMTIELGRKRVDLIYVGHGHTDNMIVMNFPAESVLFAVDFISVKSLPYKDLSDSYFPDWIDAIKVVEGIDFDILVPGHGQIGSKADVADHRDYIETLYNAVLKEARAGKSLEEMKQSIKLERFKNLEEYDEWLSLNIEGVYNRIKLHRRGK